ncbi:MAG: pitrilysin family protein [Casimicrobiaceae bacterium]
MKTARHLLSQFLVVVTAFVAFSAAAALPPGVTQGTSVEGITQYTLANGLTVLLFPDASAAKTTVNLTYLVGSRHENYGETGMAHLLEHMMFKGTTTRGDQKAELAKRGMRFNASTWYDRTNYHETFNSSPADLQWALEMEADRMVNSKVARADLDSEMTVVRNEMEMGENNPIGILIERLTGAAYDWHAYGKDTIGARSDVEGVDISRLQAFYRTYYQPDNAVLIVAGKFDPDEALATIAKTFGAIPQPARALPRLYTEEPVQDGERTVSLRRVGGAQLVAVLYHTVPGANPDATAVAALAKIMSVEPGGRLYAALVEARKATAVFSFAPALHDPGFAAFFAQVPLSDSLDAARATMEATLEGVRKDPIAPAEVERVRAKALRDFDETIADPSRLGIALSESVALGDWRLLFLQRDRWRAVTAADVQRVAEAYLKPSNRTVGTFVPEAKPDRAPKPPAVDIAAIVKDYKGDPAFASGEVFDATPANLDARTQRFTLANGMKVALLPKKTRGETVKFSMQVNQGDEKSLFGKAPQGTLAANMLKRGTTKHDRQQIEDSLDQLRSRVEFDGGESSVGVTGETTRGKLADVLRLTAEILREPAFPATEFEKLKREFVASLEESKADPDSMAQRELARLGNPYPKGDVRYQPTYAEELAEYNGAKLDDARRFHARFAGGNSAELAIVGDFDADAVKALLAELFGTWKSAAPYTRVPDPLVAKPARTVTLDTPDKANATMIGELALPLNDLSADYPAMSVASLILGDTGNSRLWQRVREKEGLSYGVGAYLQPGHVELNSSLGLNAAYAPENRERLARALAEELQRIVKDGVTETEVAEAKAGLLKRRQLSRTQDPSLAASLVQQEYLGRTFETAAKIDAAIAALSVADVNTALRKYVKPEAFAFVYAGTFRK